MKKQIYLVAAVLFTAGVILLNGCKKDDTTPPVITLSGSSSVQSILNATYTDAGATATDDEDGDITASITVNNPVDKNLAGPYTVTYSVSDAAGNTASATRSVVVYNEAASAYAGTYNASETDILGPYTYTQPTVVTASTTVNNRISMTRLGDFANNTVYMNITGTNIDLPTQTNLSVGTGTNPCDIHDRRSDGTGVKTAQGFNLTYNDEKLTPCSGSRTGVAAVFVKQ